jgi:rod shape determining protein RodA
LAGFFSRRYLEAWLGKNIFKSLVITLLPVGLIAIQPDLGSAVILVAVWVGFLLLSGIHLKRLILGIFLALIGSLLLWNFYLKPYQKDRIKAFLFPETDPFGISYNVIQSKIAIGSAGLLGKGFKNGTQTQLKFLPEAKTDFIFAAFVEEWGILGGLVLIVAFLVLVSRIIFVGLRTRSNDFKFLSLGTAVVLLTQFFINLGSNLGLTPVAGIPLPFLSYGGSSLLTSGLLVGIIQHIKLESS